MGGPELVSIGITAFVAAGLTFFSGFGLGTLLMPVMAVFFPVELAIMLTAFVHLTNNLMKLAILGRYAKTEVVLRFGVPALLAAFLGAWVLGWLSGLTSIVRYQLFGREFDVSPINVVIAGLLTVFVVYELSGKQLKVPNSAAPLVIGGLLSGFFGGLSGHQGAFRSASLLQYGFTKEQFLGTNVVIACLVDLARLSLYGTMDASKIWFVEPLGLLGILASALLGTMVARHFLQQVEMKGLRSIVAGLLIVIAIGLLTGLL